MIITLRGVEMSENAESSGKSWTRVGSTKEIRGLVGALTGSIPAHGTAANTPPPKTDEVLIWYDQPKGAFP